MQRTSCAQSAALSLTLLLTACGAPPVELPPDLVPLDEVNQAPLPGPEGDVDYPEAFNVVGGDERDYHWAHGRGYVRRPMANVWNALQDPEVTIDRRQVHEWEVKQGINPSRAASWTVKHTVHHRLATIEFVAEWNLDFRGGTPESPEVVAGRAAKIAGTPFISRLEDSIVLRAVDDDVTLVELIRHSETFNTGEAENQQYLTDVYETLRERAWGRAFPVWK